jgi:hypothetical protein
MSDDLRNRLEQLRDGLAPRDDEATFEGVQGRRRQRRNRQRLGTGIVAIVVAIAAIGFVIRAFNGSPTIPAGPPVVSPAVVSPHIGRSIKVGPQGGTSDMVAGFGELWVAVYGVSGGEGIEQDALVEVDPQTMGIVRTIGVPTVPTWEVGGGGLLATDDALWIAGSTRGATGDVATLVRVDPATGATTTSTWAGADRFVDVATDGTAIWVLGQQGPHPVVTRFDPATATFSGDVTLGGDQGRHIVAVPGAVIVSQLTWEGGSGPCLSLASVDPSADPSLRTEFPADPCSEENTVGLSPFIVGNDIWTAYKGITFTTVDPATAEPRPVEPLPYAPVHPRSGPVASDSGVWFGDYPGGNGSQPDILTRFDPSTNTVEPSNVRIGWSVGVATDDTLWAMGWDGTLTEITLVAAGVLSTPVGTASPAAGASPIDECALPTLRPTSLPWLQPGERVPPPDEERLYKRLNWFAPQGTEWDGGYVSLRLLASQGVTTGDPAPPLPDGTVGYEIKNGGEWDLFYAESSTYCGAIAMYVNLPGLSANASHSATEEIASSLSSEA